jgi:hypothetical protein
MKVTMSRNIDQAYDQYLTGRESEAIAAMRDFQAEIEKSHFKFGRFSIPTFFKAHWVTSRQDRLLKSASEHMLAILNKVVHLTLNEAAFHDFFHLTPKEKELMEIDPGYSQAVVIARFDSFLEGESLKFIELNTDSPAGMAYSDLLEDALFHSAMLREFVEGHHLRHEWRAKKLLETLLQVYDEFGGHEKPHIAIVDWRTVKTRPEFEILESVFETEGYETQICDPRDLRYKGGKLYDGDFRVDLVYRRVITNELVEKLDEVGDLIKAYRDRAVCMVNPLRSKLAGAKAVLSVLTNPGFNRFFTEAENRAKESHLPWTRTMKDAEQFYGGRKIYLINFLKDEKESIVLKPSEGYGGKDVFIGSETREDDWNRVIDRALKGDWVMQDFVPIPILTMPCMVHTRLDFTYKKVNASSFVLGKRYVSGFSRLSDESVITVARNGGLVPMVAAEEVHSR